MSECDGSFLEMPRMVVITERTLIQNFHKRQYFQVK